MGNTIIIHGRLGRDAEVRSTQAGTQITSFSIASDRKYKDKKVTSWLNCVMFNDRLAQYLIKGKELIVIGELVNEEYEKDGQKRYISKVYVNNIEFCGSKQEEKPAENTDTHYDGSSEVPF